MLYFDDDDDGEFDAYECGLIFNVVCLIYYIESDPKNFPF